MTELPKHTYIIPERAIMPDDTPDPRDERIKDLQERLDIASTTIEQLRSQLSTAQQLLNEFRAIVDSLWPFAKQLALLGVEKFKTIEQALAQEQPTKKRAYPHCPHCGREVSMDWYQRMIPPVICHLCGVGAIIQTECDSACMHK